MMLFYFHRLIEILPFFMKGLWMTIVVSGISLVLGTVFGLLLGILRASENKLLVGIIGAYVAVIRGTPFVVQIFHRLFHPAGMGHPAGRLAGGHPGPDHPGHGLYL
jgi:His/Glu/Gln/Arg/opine family amino acid ABC transporter permease subunit